MSGVASSRLGDAREQTKPTGWDRTRLGVLVPLGVVVAVAIVCIVVAALTSAQRADDVAIERERQLLNRAIVNHGEWSLLRLKNVAQSNNSVSADDINQSSAVVQSRLRAWLSPLIDHDIVMVFNFPGQRHLFATRTKSVRRRAGTGGDFARPENSRIHSPARRIDTRWRDAPARRRHLDAARRYCRTRYSCSTSSTVWRWSPWCQSAKQEPHVHHSC